MPNSREIYKARVDAALALINQNLDDDLNLEQLAQAVHFSPFHFHRIFSAVVGETPQQFVNRVRLERAANMLIKNPQDAITEIALDCGFSSSATFARAFKKHFGMTATQYRETETQRPVYSALSTAKHHNLVMKIEVEVRRMPALNLAYVSNLEGYDIDLISQAWNQLFRWGEARDLITEETRFLGISFDDPLITPAEKCRYYACITIPEGTPTRDPIGQMQIPAGKYAVTHVACTAGEIQLVYQYLYRDWLLDSGYQPADQPPYEIYYATPDNHPAGKYVLDVCIPVIPL